MPTVGGYLLWYAGAQRTDAARAALYTGLMPVSAVALAALVLAEPVGPRQLVGVACVLAGIAMSAVRPRQGARSAPRRPHGA